MGCVLCWRVFGDRQNTSFVVSFLLGCERGNGVLSIVGGSCSGIRLSSPCQPQKSKGPNLLREDVPHVPLQRLPAVRPPLAGSSPRDKLSRSRSSLEVGQIMHSWLQDHHQNVRHQRLHQQLRARLHCHPLGCYDCQRLPSKLCCQP